MSFALVSSLMRKSNSSTLISGIYSPSGYAPCLIGPAGDDNAGRGELQPRRHSALLVPALDTVGRVEVAPARLRKRQDVLEVRGGAGGGSDDGGVEAGRAAPRADRSSPTPDTVSKLREGMSS